MPSVLFWLAALGLGALLLVVSLVVGDQVTAPVAASPRAKTSRLDQVLRHRRTTSPRTALEN
jgi:hypothetical protein